MKRKIFSYMEGKISSKKINWLQTIYFNFRMLPIREAINFPVFIYGWWSFKYLDGKIIIKSPIKKGMITFGMNKENYMNSVKGSLNLLLGSKIIFDGVADISQGCSIVMGVNAILCLGSDVYFGSSVKIICYKNITIGEGSQITWESQVTDFNSHFIENLNKGQISNIMKPVLIGSFCWVGNRTSIMPGTNIPDRIIVASNSVLNKDYVEIGIKSYSLIAGTPASLVREGCKRIFSIEDEQKLFNYFKKNDVDFVLRSMLDE